MRIRTERRAVIMRRRTFDLILSMVGALLVVVLAAAGSLALWGYSYTNNSVHNQLAEQQIFFPPKSVWATAKPGTEITPAMIPYLKQYSGQQLLTGQQAEAYADHFIAIHLSEMPYHGVYALVSAAARSAKPGSAKATQLAGLEQTVFQGTTLRGLLLEAYGFWTIGQVALWASIISFILAGVMLVLSVLGFVHLRRVPAEEEWPKSRVTRLSDAKAPDAKLIDKQAAAV